MRRTLFLSQRTISLVSLPINLGQPLLGPDKTPKLLRENGLLDLLKNCGWRVNSIPEISFNIVMEKKEAALESNLRANNLTQVGSACKLIYEQGLEYASTTDFLLIIGGDHCIPIGSLAAIKTKRQRTGVVWVDAHADLHTPLTSHSGNMHGMPLGFLLGLYPAAQKLPEMGWFPAGPILSPSDIVYIGLRDLDDPEREAIKRLGIKTYTMFDVDRLGIGKVMEETNDYLKSFDNIHLSYDIDALDPFIAPHTGTSVRGGLSFREGNYICESLWATGRLNSMELVEVNPSLHSDMDPKLTIGTALSLISSAVGKTIL